ncbi:fluoride efflux transporter CrcB [Rathayibacter toxicus]|nr:fluoride efflux transporter CrcB [Rathayibacter toxicus]AJM76988.1 hypothetical protein TI83_01415 [Rathayibacter toxicus]
MSLGATEMGVVAVGGAVGTAARYAVALAVPAWSGLPIATIVVNLLGAFLLGVLAEFLAARGPDDGPRRTLRLLVGTGVLGGFTTYSTFSLDTVTLIETGRIAEAVVATAGTLLLGVLAALLGIVVVSGGRAPLGEVE